MPIQVVYKSLWLMRPKNPLRRFCIFFQLWSFKKFIDVCMILMFTFLSFFLDFELAVSKPTAAVPITRTFAVSFLYAQIGWFTLSTLTSTLPSHEDIIAFGMSDGAHSVLGSLPNFIDFVLCFFHWSKIDYMISLSSFRLLRLVGYLCQTSQFANLQEITIVLKKSITSVLSIILLMMGGLLFSSMFLNNLTVRRRLTAGRRGVHQPVQVPHHRQQVPHQPDTRVRLRPPRRCQPLSPRPSLSTPIFSGIKPRQ